MGSAVTVDLHELSARQAVAAVADGKCTIEALAEAHIQRAQHVEADVRAWQHFDPDAALAEARRLDKAPRGPLSGMLIGVKDVICTADMPTTFGSAAYAGFRPPFDASCVAMARTAGAMILGKTVSTEFAAASPGPTRNPHRPTHTPGGSSSGSAAAVAAKLVPVALGTQTAGSTIRPAAFCGVVGYKPSYALADATGIKTLSACFDTLGIFARDVADIGLYAAHVTGQADLDSDATIMPKVGIYRTEAWDLARPEATAAIERAAIAIGAGGGSVSEIPLMTGFDKLLEIHQDMMDWGVATGLWYERTVLHDAISTVSAEMLDSYTARASRERFLAAESRAIAARNDIDRLFGDCDIILTPPATGEAPEGLASTGDASFNRGWTMLHLPCITIPAGTGPTGLPVGIQLIARKNDDARLLAAARFVEAALAP
jgi:amidase